MPFWFLVLFEFLIVFFLATKGANSETLNLKMTAAELRAKLAAKKKYDPKNDTVDLRKKYEIVQKLWMNNATAPLIQHTLQ